MSILNEYINKNIVYSKEAGSFFWINGKKAGSINNKGYLVIKILNKSYKAHKIAWLISYGVMVSKELQIDHINGDRLDNRIDNLRIVDNRLNHINRKTHRNGRLYGCSFHKANKKWKAEIRINGVKTFIGYYSTELEAHNAYKVELDKMYDRT